MDSFMFRLVTSSFSFLLILGAACLKTEDTSTDSTDALNLAYEFALLGDNPYPPENVPKFEALISEVNLATELEWVIHVGDILGPSSVGCSDEVLTGRFDLYQRFQHPFVFTPGDNDWFDCRSEAAGGFDEYERLDFLRELFFPQPGLTTGGRAMEVRAQSNEAGFEEFVENVMWVRSGVVFSTVHIVAMNRPATDPERARRRMDAALAWIRKTFEVATELDSPGVLIATQDDPWRVTGSRGTLRQIRKACPDCLQPRAHLEPLYPVLERETVAFGRPVVLAVGNTHVFRVDKPLYSSETGLLIENFTRVETFGHPSVHWVRVRVDPSDGEVFAFEQEIVDANVAKARSQ